MTRARDLADFNLDGKAVTINESSADLDFRVESNGNANMLVVDAGNDRIGIGTNTPAHDVEIVVTNAGSVNDSLQIRNNATSSGTGSRIRFINSTDNTSDANGASIHSVRNGDDNDLVFETENVERMKILAGGNVDISAGHILLDNGYGIDFSAAASASGMSSEILDDYEEGTWTASFNGSSGTATGRYVKIGGSVFVTVYSGALNVTSSGTATISGLPFTNNGPYTAASVTHDTYSNDSYNAYVQESGTTITAIQDGTVSGAQTVVGNPKYIMISAVYYTAS